MGLKIESTRGFDIYRCHDGHTIHNGRYHWAEAHAHGIKSLDICHQIIDNVIHQRIPTSKCGYVYDSHIRLAGDTEYREELIGVRERRRSRNQMYFNSNKGVR